MRIIRLPTDGRTLATGSTLSLEERGKPIDGFTGRVPMCPRGCATPSWPACHPQISGGRHKAANDNGAGWPLIPFPCRRFATGKISSPAGGAAMTTRLEFKLRAALCRQLAKREPANRSLWMAEAEKWLRLSKEKLQGEAEAKSVPARPVSARQAPAP